MCVVGSDDRDVNNPRNNWERLKKDINKGKGGRGKRVRLSLPFSSFFLLPLWPFPLLDLGAIPQPQDEGKIKQKSRVEWNGVSVKRVGAFQTPEELRGGEMEWAD